MTPWGRATTALRLLALDPDGLGGILLHARAGPARDAFLAALSGPSTRLHPSMTQDTLSGGIDVSQSLSEGTLVRQKGLLEGYDTQFVLPMAERTPPLMAAQLATALDAKRGLRLIALDEHSEDEPPAPLALQERLAFHISFDGLGLHDVGAVAQPELVHSDPRNTRITGEALNTLTTLAVSLGITSLRAPLLALTAARAHAALHGRDEVAEPDIQAAAELVLAPRATQFPQEHQDPPPPPEEQRDETQSTSQQTTLPDEILLEAIETALPSDLLHKTDSNTGKSAGSGAGQKRIGNRRGRPLPARGTASGDARVDLIATLRAAVPWQTLRRATQPDRTGPIIHPSDLRHRRYEELSDRLLIFAVDASGSAALARLAEAKGAVELLLAEAYARRDHVALISFRGDGAETLLPPTRSLVQTKRRLAALPGGGGTPLAAGLRNGLETALKAQRKGMSPVLILLTDGRSNVALDGSADRAQAASDASDMARHIARAGIDSIVIDTGRRPERALRDLSLSLRGRYVSLPRANAQALSETVSAALSD